MQKKLSGLIVFLLIMVILSVSSPVLAIDGQTAAHTIEKKTYPHLYCFEEGTEHSGELNLYFMDGGDVPYVALSEFIPVMTEMYNTVLKCDEGDQITYEVQSIPQDNDDMIFIVTRPDNNSS